MSNLETLIEQPFICRWLEEWTNKVNAVKNWQGEEREILKMVAQIRLMNCMKMYGLGITSQGYLLVQNQRSRGEPFIFWKHNLKGKKMGEEEWKVVAGKAVDGVGLVLKNPWRLDIDDDDGINPDEMGFVKPVAQPAPSFNLFKDTIQTCYDIVGVDNCTDLVVAVKKYKEHDVRLSKVLASEKKLVVVTEEHMSNVKEYEEINPIIKIVNASSTGKALSNEEKPSHNRPSKKARQRKRHKLLGEATSSFYSSVQ